MTTKENYDATLMAAKLIMDNEYPGVFDRSGETPMLFTFIRNGDEEVIDITIQLYEMAARYGWTSRKADEDFLQAISKAWDGESQFFNNDWVQEELRAIIDFAAGLNDENPLVVETY